ncbi:MAG: hypothetical protein OXP11_07965 [Gammaproteobacteria bacterium]|nr:hypothetical protein [Gammaproteobacteria bacterium]
MHTSTSLLYYADFFRTFTYARMAIILLIYCRANGIPADQVPYDNSYYMNQVEQMLGI